MAKLLDRYRKVENQVDAGLIWLAAKSYTAVVLAVALGFVAWALWH